MAIEDSFYSEFLQLALKAFAGIPLTNRNSVYNIYGGTGPTANYDEAVLVKFLNELIALKQQAPGVLHIEVQGLDDANGNWSHLTEDLIRGLTDGEKRDIWYTFYHFRRSHTNALKRLYLHTKTPIETAGLTVFKELFKVRNVGDGLVNLKIGGPGCTDRADTIVVYFSKNESLQAMINALQTNQFPGHWFEASVPLGAFRMSYLNKGGIAGADEVPGKHDIFKGGSYGMFLSTLIFEGYKQVYVPWERQNAGATQAAKKEKFLNSVLLACKAAKVDPKTIYLTQQDHKKLILSDEQLAKELASQAKNASVAPTA